MNRKTILIVVAFAVFELVTSFSAEAKANPAKKSGLIGGQFGSEDFTNLQNLSRLSSLSGPLLKMTPLSSVEDRKGGLKARNIRSRLLMSRMVTDPLVFCRRQKRGQAQILCTRPSRSRNGYRKPKKLTPLSSVEDRKGGKMTMMTRASLPGYCMIAWISRIPAAACIYCPASI